MELLVQMYVMFELHIVILFLTMKGKTVGEIHRELVQMYGENCIDDSNVRNGREILKTTIVYH